MYTGNTVIFPSLRFSHSVYPCVYREHSDPEIGEYKYIGLSLCIQGTRVTGQSRAFFGKVYPCVYREHIKTYSEGNDAIGLSLCIQGTHFCMLF